MHYWIKNIPCGCAGHLSGIVAVKDKALAQGLLKQTHSYGFSLCNEMNIFWRMLSGDV